MNDLAAIKERIELWRVELGPSVGVKDPRTAMESQITGLKYLYYISRSVVGVYREVMDPGRTRIHEHHHSIDLGVVVAIVVGDKGKS